MPRQFFTASDIYQLSREQRSDVLLLSPDDVITQEAEDLANSLGLRLMREATAKHSTNEQKLVESNTIGSRALPPIKIVRGQNVVLAPFGESLAAQAANVQLKDVVTSSDRSSMAAGYMSLDKGAFPWTLSYDEIDIVLEGELVITHGTETVQGAKGDVIFIPKGSSISFSTPSKVRFVYVTFPADWNEKK
jgi:ethanolamine utilization protein EutQ